MFLGWRGMIMKNEVLKIFRRFGLFGGFLCWVVLIGGLRCGNLILLGRRFKVGKFRKSLWFLGLVWWVVYLLKFVFF